MRSVLNWSSKMNKYLAALLCVFALYGCSESVEQPPVGEGSELSGKVRLDGSSTVFPISEAVAEGIQRRSTEGACHRWCVRYRRGVQEVRGPER